jgi:catechol 2,3-dioxygenase-like lactoylglutathione lyase family enzyme
MNARIEKVSAITLNVADMGRSLLFYRDVLGLELLYGEPSADFSSLRIPGTESPIINLQQSRASAGWGRMIFYVADVDAFWTYLKERRFDPDVAQNASWGERYFHMNDPDGHELSFARPLSRSA